MLNDKFELQRLTALMEKYDLDEHDILCYVGIGSARGAEFAIAENDFLFAKKLHSVSKAVDLLLLNETRRTNSRIPAQPLS